MFLEKLTLTNFKCFSHQELRLGKITLLLGANSTGKSSLLHGILSSLQSDQFPFVLSPNGDMVNLGDFTTFSHRHNKDQFIGVSLEFKHRESEKTHFSGLFGLAKETGMPVLNSAELREQEFEIKVTRENQYKAVWKYNYELDPQRKFIESGTGREFYQALDKLMREIQKDKKDSSKTKKHVINETHFDPFTKPDSSGEFTFSHPPEIYKAFNRLQPKNVFIGPKLAHMGNILSEFRRSFNYIGSFRSEPERSYYQVSKGDLKIHRDGANYIEQISEWQENGAAQLNKLRRALRSMKLLSGLKTTILKNGLFEVNVMPLNAKKMFVCLADVGFGIGQILPILVADIQLPKGSTLAVSQPEIHLHPVAQADFADYLLHRTHETGNRYIIETHSEYLINRLRLLVTQEKLSSDDLSIIYLTNNGITSTSHILTFTKSGRIEGAPKDFFSTYMLDVMNIAINAK